MRKLAIFMASIMLLVPISGAMAGGAARTSSHARMKKAHHKRLKQDAKFWKKFDARMARAAKGIPGPKRSHSDDSAYLNDSDFDVPSE